MSDIVLPGCRPEPLMSYLKALGVLRLVAEQRDATARAWWRAGTFVLRSTMDRASLMRFFLQDYSPTPVVAPWAGGSGFFAKDNTSAVDAIAASEVRRLTDYRAIIQQVRGLLKEERVSTKPSGETKERLLRIYRRQLPDRFIAWMDCAMVLQEARLTFSPLLGTGGNDGRLDFTQNFMQRLVEIGFCKERLSDWAESMLAAALFDTPIEAITSGAVGQFDPGSVGGPNATQGMEGQSLVNPWAFALMIEGAILLAGSVVRRLGHHRSDRASIPFTVAPSSVGYGSASSGDLLGSRGETWLPLWGAPTGFAELRALFSEGRAEVSGKQSRDGVEFARAVAGLGVDRGILEFTRYGYLKRSGKAYLASPLGRVEVRHEGTVDLLHSIDLWLGSLRRAARDAPPRIPSALRRLDLAVFELCRHGGKARFASVLRALGQIERELAVLRGKVGQWTVSPVPVLSDAWLEAGDDGSREFRIAAALASIRGDDGNRVGPLRSNLESVAHFGRGISWAERGRSVVWSSADLCRNLAAVLERRVMDGARLGLEVMPLDAARAVHLSDVAAFIEGSTDDRLLEEFLWGACLVDFRWHSTVLAGGGEQANSPLPRAYALLKLLFMPPSCALRSRSDGRPVHPEPGILALLRAGHVDSACAVAARRLRASGYVAMPGPFSGGRRRRASFAARIDSRRLVASLLIPVTQREVLAGMVLRREEEAHVAD